MYQEQQGDSGTPTPPTPGTVVQGGGRTFMVVPPQKKPMTAGRVFKRILFFIIAIPVAFIVLGVIAVVALKFLQGPVAIDTAYPTSMATYQSFQPNSPSVPPQMNTLSASDGGVAIYVRLKGSQTGTSTLKYNFEQGGHVLGTYSTSLPSDKNVLMGGLTGTFAPGKYTFHVFLNGKDAADVPVTLK